MNWINIAIAVVILLIFIWLLKYQIEKYQNFLRLSRTLLTSQKNWKYWTVHVVRILVMVLTGLLLALLLVFFVKSELWVNDSSNGEKTEEVVSDDSDSDNTVDKKSDSEKNEEKPKVEKPEDGTPVVVPPSEDKSEDNSFEQEKDSLKNVIDKLKDELLKKAKNPQPKPNKPKSKRQGYIWKG